MTQTFYATPEMVKQFRKGRRKPNGEMPDFPESLELMAREGVLSEEPLPMPHLDGRMSKEAFITAFDRIPFNASRVLANDSIREKEQQSDVIFPTGQDVMCVQHIHDYGYREHRFHDFFSISYLYKGRCNFKFGEEILELTEGDLLIVTPGFRNSVHAFSDSFAFEAMLRQESFHIVFNDFLAAHSRLSDFFSSFVRGNNRNYCVLHCDPEDDEIRFYLQSFVCENTLQEVYSNSCSLSLLKLFLAHAFRKYKESMVFYRNDFHMRRMDAESIYSYIRDHYVSITLDQTADYFHYNKTYLSRFIHAHFGRSFMELVTEMKIDHAREYLRNTGKHISDIALLVGYDTPDHFSRMFRKEEGVSPAVYRKRIREQQRL